MPDLREACRWECRPVSILQRPLPDPRSCQLGHRLVLGTCSGKRSRRASRLCPVFGRKQRQWVSLSSLWPWPLGSMSAMRPWHRVQSGRFALGCRLGSSCTIWGFHRGHSPWCDRDCAIWYLDCRCRRVHFGSRDPSRVVIDEVIGQWIAIAPAAQDSWPQWIAALILFRFFDIAKPFGIRRLEALEGGLGVVADDVGAGVCAMLECC